MQHSQLRRIGETVKLFAHKNPAFVVKELEVLQLKDGSLTDITESYVVNELNPGYFSTEVVCPRDDCYLLIKFCESPIVLRVGDPELNFIFVAKPNLDVPYKRYDEFGTVVSSGNLTELEGGWYYKDDINTSLGFIEVYNRPYIISLPYCDGSLSVAVQVIWNSSVQVKKFGATTIKASFKTSTLTNSFTQKTELNNFKTSLSKQLFKENTVAMKFTKQC